jgi:queuine/archaeosine tRNA-ribosyltransferase
MTFHLIVTCVSQKKVKKTHSIIDSSIKPGTILDVFDQWNETLKNSKLKSRKAIDLYKGSLWDSYKDAWGIVNSREKDAKLWILSAGYGLISSEDRILPYDITFQENRNGIPSIQAKIINGNNDVSRRNIIQGWWDLLSTSSERNPSSLKTLIGQSSSDDYFLIVLGKDYLHAIFEDLQMAIKTSKTPNQIAVISNNVDDPLAKRLGSNWLYADSRFVNLNGANNTVVNAKIAKELLWFTYHEKKGTSWWSHKNFNSYLKQLSSTLPEANRPVRPPRTDEQVKSFIRNSLAIGNAPFSKLHRSYRDSGQACEYNRFKNLYSEVKIELNNKASLKRPNFPVTHKKRKTKMLFFLPDWDDRVDPLFDFENDVPTPNRDPYEHDAYHYELYGTLNCDGILISKSVLEDNATKKEKAKQLGIHKYLRLPSNVPVLGDCGAFNYILDENPPYNTEEILNYYEEFGFDYGVSIDHLIVPGILKRIRYMKLVENDWNEISETEFENLKNHPKTKILKTQKSQIQKDLFEEKNLILKETYIDENEQLRRYNLTIENAAQFIEGHKKKNFSFTPIGAVQGWDPDSYADAVNEYQQMGYDYIALGGLVKSNTPKIIEILKKIAPIKKKETRIHLFGVARLDAIEAFIKLGVSSVDSAGMLRQAWLSSSSNYYAPDMNHFSAIRVPPADKGKASKQALKVGSISKDELLERERSCLNALRSFDRGFTNTNNVLDKLRAYATLFDQDEKLFEKYLRTLTEQPWKKCSCKLCQETGIDIIIFRRNNRNRRRGFHNTWEFFNKFKGLTDID